MTGPFIAHSTVMQCHSCSRIFKSDLLPQMVQKWCNVGYDTLVHVGRALFQRYRTIKEVSAELHLRNVNISDSEIGYLGKKFIYYLALCHQRATPKMRESMAHSGGYVLHLDATHEGNAPALMTALDSLSEIVLGNVKIPSEHSDYIVPFLKKLQKDFDTPRACVHDMGKGICKAVSMVFPGTPDFICHFHFLRDIGKDFLESAYSSLRSCLRKHTTSTRLHALAREIKQQLIEHDSTPELMARSLISGELPEKTDQLPLVLEYALVLWMLNGKNSGDGYGFPFDRPLLVFAERILEAQHHLPELLAHGHDADNIGKYSSVKLTQIVSDITNDIESRNKIQELRWRCQVFDQLRKAMRIALPADKKGLNDEGTTESMFTIRAAVEGFRRQLDNNAKRAADKLCSKMAKQIDNWSEKLFADPIKVDTPNGQVMIYPQRTNNILEQFFRDIRRGYRRKTGNNTMCKLLQTILADTPLVKNLDNDDYMNLLLDGKGDLEQLFADVESTINADHSDQPDKTDRILQGFRELITLKTLPMHLTKLLSGKAN